MRSYRGDRSFGVVLVTINTILLMPDDAQRMAVLETARANLRRGGLLVIDALGDEAPELEAYDGRLQLEWSRRDPETGEDVAKLISARHDEEAATVTLTQQFDVTPAGGGPVRRRARVDVLHLLPGSRWSALAAAAGFGDIDLRGDYRLTPYSAGSQRALLMARAL